MNNSQYNLPPRQLNHQVFQSHTRTSTHNFEDTSVCCYPVSCNPNDAATLENQVPPVQPVPQLPLQPQQLHVLQPQQPQPLQHQMVNHDSRDLPPDINSPPKHLPIKSLKDRYHTVSPLGNGSFGCVFLAKRREKYSYPLDSYNTLMQPIPNETAIDSPLVAIKTMNKRLPRLKDYTKVKEIKFIMAVPSHPNLVFIHEMFIDNINFQLHIVMETMDQNLYQFMKARKGQRFSENSVKSILSQILNAIRHIHRNGYFHRDVKPENILISNNASRFSVEGQMNTNTSLYNVKLADYGLARSQTNKKPFTAYVSTRWYRSPEILFRQRSYSKPVDIWAFGCVAAEIAASRPLFPGNHELEQIWMILDTLGSPNPFSELPNTPLGGYWNDASFLASMLGFQLPNTQGTTIENVVGRSNTPLLCDVVHRCLTWDPDARIDVESLCEMPYFANTIVSFTNSTQSSKIQNIHNKNLSLDIMSNSSAGTNSKFGIPKSETFAAIKSSSAKLPLASKMDNPRKSYIKKPTVVTKNNVNHKVTSFISLNEESAKRNDRFVSENSNCFGPQAYQPLDHQVVQCVPPREIPPIDLLSGVPKRNTTPRSVKRHDVTNTQSIYCSETTYKAPQQQNTNVPNSQAPAQLYNQNASMQASQAIPFQQPHHQQQKQNISFSSNMYSQLPVSSIPRNPTPLRSNISTNITSQQQQQHQAHIFNPPVEVPHKNNISWINPPHPYSNSDVQSTNILLSQMTFSPKNECFSVCDSATDSVMSKVTPSLKNVLQDCSSSIESGDFESEKYKTSFFHDGVSNQGFKHPMDSFAKDMHQSSVMNSIDINTDTFTNSRQKITSQNNWQQNIINTEGVNHMKQSQYNDNSSSFVLN